MTKNNYYGLTGKQQDYFDFYYRHKRELYTEELEKILKYRLETYSKLYELLKDYEDVSPYILPPITYTRKEIDELIEDLTIQISNLEIKRNKLGLKDKE